MLLELLWKSIGQRLELLVDVACREFSLALNLVLNRVNDALFQLFNLVANSIILLDLVTIDHLCHKESLIVIKFGLAIAIERFLHFARVESFLFVACLYWEQADARVGLRDDGNEQVQKHDDIEDAAKNEDHPLTIVHLLNSDSVGEVAEGY